MCSTDSLPRVVGVDHVRPESPVVTTWTSCGTFFVAERPARPPETWFAGRSSTAKRPLRDGSAATKTPDPAGMAAETTWRFQCAPASVLVSNTAHGQVLPGTALAVYAAARTPWAAAILP